MYRTLPPDSGPALKLPDAEMKSIFDRFPEVMLSDSTYKTNNVNMALYVLLATDGHSESHIIAAFLLSTNDKASLTDTVTKFKQKNPAWETIKCLITDQDMTERSIFKAELPQIHLQICLYHTLRTFSREITMDKMNIYSQRHSTTLKILERLAYAVDETTYMKNYEDFKVDVPENVQTYFNSNWHPIRDQWAKGLKTYHLGN